MPAQIYPVPFASGMNQALSTVLGEPRLMRCERVRLIEPGKMAVSPGYYRAMTDNGYLRARVQAGESLCVASSRDGHLTSKSYTRSGSLVDRNLDWHMPAFEPPIRVDMAGGVRTKTTACWVAPTMPTDPTGWYAVAVVYTASVTLEQATLSIFSGTTLLQTYALAQGTNVTWRVATDSTTGIGWLVKLDSAAHTIKFHTVVSGAIPAILVRTWACNAISITDVACTTFGGVLYFCVLDSNSYIHVISAVAGVINIIDAHHSAAPATEIAMLGGLLLRTTAVGYVQSYDYVAGTANSTDALLGSNGAGKCALSKFPTPASTYLTATLEITDVTTGQIGCSCYVIQMAAGAIATSLLGNSAKSTFLLGAPLRLETSIAYQNLANYSTVLRSAIIRQAPDNYSNLNLTMAAIAANGEIPMRAQVSQGAGVWASATPAAIYIRDSLCGELKRAYVFCFPTAVGGNLSGAECDLGVTAIICAADSTAMPTGGHAVIGFDALCPIRVDGSSVIWTGAHPWIDGDDQVATGFAIDGPPPVVTPNDAASGTSIFVDGEVYQYCVRAEFRDAAGTLYRSAPTAPVSYTVVPNTTPGYTFHLSHSVAIAWLDEAPAMPGSIHRLYRTVANGTVFYDTGTIASPSVTSTMIDLTSNAALISNPLLTEGPAVAGGLKAKYAVPPCRFGWRGKDRLIVGGLESSSRVRWSQTIYPGEAICFPHASELGLTMDFPDDVTAVASLDDAWIIFSRGQIWSVFGSGPEDNGTNGAFEAPRLLTSDCGCLTWRSVAEIQEGLLFQATNGQIYLLTRGQLALQWYSAPVQLELARGMLGTRLRNPIVATVVHPTTETIHFIRAAMPDGTDSAPLVFDRRTQCWSLDGDGVSDGLKGAISGAAIIDCFSSPLVGCETICTVTPTNITLENATGAVIAPIQGTWTALVETNDIAPFGIAGWGKVSKIGIVSSTAANTSFNYSSWRDRNQDATPNDTTALALTDSGGAEFPFISRTPQMDKCSAIRVRFEWSDRATYPAALVLRVEPSADAQRVASTRRT